MREARQVCAYPGPVHLLDVADSRATNSLLEHMSISHFSWKCWDGTRSLLHVAHFPKSSDTFRNRSRNPEMRFREPWRKPRVEVGVEELELKFSKSQTGFREHGEIP